MTTAPFGAAIVDLCKRRSRDRLNTRSTAPTQLAEPLQRLAALRRALDRWDADHGRGDMPQPTNFGLAMRDLRPSEIYWRRAA